jgi:hypothetical protein
LVDYIKYDTTLGRD